MKLKHGLIGVGLLAIACLIVVQVGLAQSTPPLPPLPPGYEEWLENQANSFNTFSFPVPGEGGGEGGTNDPVEPSIPYNFEGLGIYVPTVLTNGQLLLTLFENGTNATYAFTNNNYDIYGQRKLGDFHYRWHEIAAGAVGQTNFYIPNPAPSNMFYIALLGTDTDSDGLTDGFETVVSKTSITNAYTAGGSLSDFELWRIGANPTNTAGIVPDTNGVVNLRVHTRLK